ncbi:hypothetical protein JXA31_07995 [Candidatus Bathyarchaeota archaeon]|nr:hypothetical protein [Candidatus Bathyarchaeota archaeon]
MKDRQPIKTQFLRLTKKTRKRIENDTQRLRKEIMEDLKQMFVTAKKMATAADAEPKQTQHWIRVMGYIGQVINSLAKSFDETKALEQIEHIEKMINEADAEQSSST